MGAVSFGWLPIWSISRGTTNRNFFGLHVDATGHGFRSRTTSERDPDHSVDGVLMVSTNGDMGSKSRAGKNWMHFGLETA